MKKNKKLVTSKTSIRNKTATKNVKSTKRLKSIRKTVSKPKQKIPSSKKTKHKLPVEVTVIIKKEEPVQPVEKKIKKPSIEKMYFTSDTEDKIVQYNQEVDDRQRNYLYETFIKFPFEKLVENVFNTFKFSYFDNSPTEIQKETVAHLVANIHKFEKDKGKAFSYFSIVAKHYLIFHNNSNYKRFNQHVNIADTPSDTTVCLQTVDAHHTSTELKEYVDLTVKYWETNVSRIFTKQRDLNIANAVIELFRNSDRIDYFNKKALYLYIREISSCKTQQITKVLSKMKQYQDIVSKSYKNEGDYDQN